MTEPKQQTRWLRNKWWSGRRGLGAAGVACAMVAGALVWGIGGLAGAAGGSRGPDPSTIQPAPPTTQPPPPIGPQGLSPEKVALLPHWSTATHIGPPVVDPDAHKSLDSGNRASGILDTGQAPFSMQDFEVSNQYLGKYNDQYITVWAGVKVAPPNPGCIDPACTVGEGLRVGYGIEDSNISTYLDPAIDGLLKITNVDGSEVTLTSVDAQDASNAPAVKQTVTFSLATDTFGPVSTSPAS